jgi:hypothetical protein
MRRPAVAAQDIAQGAAAPCQLEMLDTLEVTKDLLSIAVVLTSSPGHMPGERAEGRREAQEGGRFQMIF